MSLRVPREFELYRIQLPGYPWGNAQNGAFSTRDGLRIIVGTGDGWEHVSVSRKSRIPSYEDMDRVKRIFWDDGDTVMQLHVARNRHINNNENVLHLWRPLDAEIPTPPLYMV